MADSRCLKITEKVSFNVASEASYVYIKSGQKFIKNAKIGQVLQLFDDLALRSNSVTRLISIGKTVVRNAQISKFKCDVFE